MLSSKPRVLISALTALPFTGLFSTQRSLSYTSRRLASNTVLNFVPQQEAWVIERMGRYLKTLQPGLNILLPIIDSVKYVQPLKEIAMEIPEQSAITLDNVQLTLDGVLYASYGVEDPEFAVKQLAQTTMRSEVGKIILDTVFKEREVLNIAIVEAINKAAEPWGIVCLRYEIRDMKMPQKIQEAMQ
uniref:Band 7 domain-containing protein n=1 Tax=Meloidogyne javanica TaxID=6303 RepID=A0A915LCK8_MELJA